MLWLIFLLFLLGLYVCLTQSSYVLQEGFKPRCPNVLIDQGNELWLKNTNLADIPGVNPVIFHNLDEYTQFVEWQKSQGIDCPLLYMQKGYNAQNETVYHVKPPPLHLTDASRNDPPYNQNSYPAHDQTDYYIGTTTPLDAMDIQAEKAPISPDPMNPNWGGSEYTEKLINQEYYKDNYVIKTTAAKNN